jgi:sterol desaturase/sphingolipid hydroxylase (fatty acid hydroxylase superfamily)
MTSMRDSEPSTASPERPPAAPQGNAPSPASRSRWTRILVLLGLAALGLGIARILRNGELRAQLTASLGAAPGNFARTFLDETLLNPWFYGVLGLVLLLERLIPARPEQKSLSRGAIQDLLWMPWALFSQAFFLPLHILFLRSLYDRYLAFLTIDSVALWPGWARFLLALLAADFLFWFSHFVRHKVTVLWYFHAVHHSQKEMNFFTEYRVHPIDEVFLYTIGFIPFFMLGQPGLSIVAIVWIRHWHTRLYHANIRSNFGWLRYVLVTPQSHRVHHSIEEKHHDRNFGLTFSIWDHLFGTQYRKYDEYPETGINDLDFPFDQEKARFSVVGRLFAQLLYPFGAIAGDAITARRPSP